MVPPSSMSDMSHSNGDSLFDVVVVGGGVVGLAIVKTLVCNLPHLRVACVEARHHLLTCASGSNSGIACTGVDAPLGSLERACIRDSISTIRPFCREMNIPFRECGSLVCLWPWDECCGSQEEKLRGVAMESWDAGDTHARILNHDQLLELEPALSKEVIGGVHIPGEIMLDPWLFSIAFAVQARHYDAEIYTNWEYDPKRSYWDDSLRQWTLRRKSNYPNSPDLLHAKILVNASGIYSDQVQSNTSLNQTTDSGLPTSPFEARPRRGQYYVYSQTSNTKLVRPIQPVPTQYSKGIFVFSSLYDQIVVGPTALDQTSRDDTTIHGEVRETLRSHAHRILPQSSEEQFIGEYVGIRPGTSRRDYQISSYPTTNWITVGGIRSTGLTASMGIGRFVFRLVIALLGEKYQTSQEVVASGRAPCAIPSIQSLVEEFHASGEEEVVTIHGHKYKVTHPITRFGWKARTGLAA